MSVIKILSSGAGVELSRVDSHNLGNFRGGSKSSSSSSIATAASLVRFSFFEEGEGLSNSGSSLITVATVDFRNAVGIFTDEFTFGFGAVGFVTLPVASGFFAHGFAFRFRSLAVGNAVRLFAHSDTFRAVEHFAAFIRAFNLKK